MNQHTQTAYNVIKHALRVPPASRIASVQAQELMALAGTVLRVCPNCSAEDWRGTCELCGVMTRLVVPCPFPSVGSSEWHWAKAQRWEDRRTHKWTSPYSRYWVA